MGEDKSEAKGTAKLVTSPSSSRRSIITNFRTGIIKFFHHFCSMGKSLLTDFFFLLEEIRGYLFKKTRDGKWQKRWFETNGCFLTYYKVNKWLQNVCVA